MGAFLGAVRAAMTPQLLVANIVALGITECVFKIIKKKKSKKFLFF